MIEDLGVLPTNGEGWHRVANNEGTITDAMTDVHQINDGPFSVSTPDPDDENIEYLNGTRARIVIDSETATARRFRVTAHFRDTYDEEDPSVVRSRSTVQITHAGDLDIERPEGLAGPGPLERFWDVVYYG